MFEPGLFLVHRRARQRAGQPDGGALEQAPPRRSQGDRAKFRKTLTAAVAALTLAGATMTTISRAQAGSLGKAVAIGILSTAVGVIAGAASAQAQENADREAYRPRGGYGYEPGSRRVRAYDGGCGFRNGPIFDEYGDRIDARCVPAC